MVRSFHYAAYAQILLNDEFTSADRQILAPWCHCWYSAVSRFYLDAYFEAAGRATFLPKPLEPILQSYLLEKAIYELGYELNSRPDWVGIPLEGIMYIINNYLRDKK